MLQESKELLGELDALATRGNFERDTTAAAHFVALMRVAKSFRRIFRLPVPDAPGLCFVGAEVDAAAFPIAEPRNAMMSASGKGTDLVQAACTCASEGTEFLSQLAWGDEAFQLGSADVLETGLDPVTVTQMLAMLGLDRAAPVPPIQWTEATRVTDGAGVLIPAGLCYRNLDQPGQPAIKLSSGCGAGIARDAALLHGLLELIERDAIALWWLGGRKCRQVSVELMQTSGAAILLGELRRGTASRSTWLLDITTDIGIPTIAALSVDSETGRGLVGGFCAGLRYVDAIRNAVLELCQIELGLHIIELKRRQRGDSALNEVDLKHLRRARELDAGNCSLLYPADSPSQGVSDEIARPIAYIARRLSSLGMQVFFVDLTRPALGIPVVRALATGLQPMPSTLVTPRLARQIADTGGGFGLTNGIELI
jgi:ribosomal protein S12 methylthiotransferase accessory factor